MRCICRVLQQRLAFFFHAGMNSYWLSAPKESAHLGLLLEAGVRGWGGRGGPTGGGGGAAAGSLSLLLTTSQA